MKTSLLFFFLLSVFSCKEATVSSTLKVCGVNDPVRNLPWLKAMIEDARLKKQDKILTIRVGELKGQPVFDYYLSYMSCLSCIVYHCDGSRVDFSKYTEQEVRDYMSTVRGGGSGGPVIWPQK